MSIHEKNILKLKAFEKKENKSKPKPKQEKNERIS